VWRPSVYGLDVVAEAIEDHAGNQTRFVLVTRAGVPRPTGHDRTALVVYQRADEPGSLISILQEFAARRINLSNLISRPTKRGGLGDYCFIIFAEGHVADDLLADAMRALHAKQGGVKFFGSYPRPTPRRTTPASMPTPAGATPTTGSPTSAATSPDPATRLGEGVYAAGMSSVPDASTSTAASPDGAAHVTVVTGANSGIGRATSIHLAASGHRVIGTVRTVARAEKLAAMAAQAGVEVELVELDVADDDSVRDGFAEIFDRTGGRVDHLVNNAGVGGNAVVEESSIELFWPR
jgi:hypothetical protein